jgi:hypothetical protein
MSIESWDLEYRYMKPEELSRGYPWVSGMGDSVPTYDEANLLTSRLRSQIGDTEAIGQMHYILLDLDDMDVELVESSSGNHHLYIKHAITTSELDKLVAVLEEIGLIEPGIKRGWDERKALCLRKPGVKKGVEAP